MWETTETIYTEFCMVCIVLYVLLFLYCILSYRWIFFGLTFGACEPSVKARGLWLWSNEDAFFGLKYYFEILLHWTQSQRTCIFHWSCRIAERQSKKIKLYMPGTLLNFHALAVVHILIYSAMGRLWVKRCTVFNQCALQWQIASILFAKN